MDRLVEPKLASKYRYEFTFSKSSSNTGDLAIVFFRTRTFEQSDRAGSHRISIYPQI